MADSLLENYNPLYDVHLRQYFALPHMQKHLRRMGLLDSNGVPVSQNGNVESELYARHHAMMDMMLRNRERVLMQLADLQKKYDAAEKVEIYRRVRSGVTDAEEFRRNHLSRSLSRPRRSATQPVKTSSGRRRHSSNSFEDTEVIKRIENTYEQPQTPQANIKNTYDRLSANTFKYQFLHKLDDTTLINYKDSLQKQLHKLKRFRDISFGPNNIARHQTSQPASWFFRRRSLPSLSNSAPQNSLHSPIRSLKAAKDAHEKSSNGTAVSTADEHRRRQGKSQSPRRHLQGADRPRLPRRTASPTKRAATTHAGTRLPPIHNKESPPKPPRVQQRVAPSPPKPKEEDKPAGFLGKIAGGVAAAAAVVGGTVAAAIGVGESDEEKSKEATEEMDTTEDDEVQKTPSPPQTPEVAAPSPVHIEQEETVPSPLPSPNHTEVESPLPSPRHEELQHKTPSPVDVHVTEASPRQSPTEEDEEELQEEASIPTTPQHEEGQYTSPAPPESHEGESNVERSPSISPKHEEVQHRTPSPEGLEQRLEQHLHEENSPPRSPELDETQQRSPTPEQHHSPPHSPQHEDIHAKTPSPLESYREQPEEHVTHEFTEREASPEEEEKNSNPNEHTPNRFDEVHEQKAHSFHEDDLRSMEKMEDISHDIEIEDTQNARNKRGASFEAEEVLEREAEERATEFNGVQDQSNGAGAELEHNQEEVEKLTDEHEEESHHGDKSDVESLRSQHDAEYPSDHRSVASADEHLHEVDHADPSPRASEGHSPVHHDGNSEAEEHHREPSPVSQHDFEHQNLMSDIENVDPVQQDVETHHQENEEFNDYQHNDNGHESNAEIGHENYQNDENVEHENNNESDRDQHDRQSDYAESHEDTNERSVDVHTTNEMEQSIYQQNDDHENSDTENIPQHAIHQNEAPLSPPASPTELLSPESPIQKAQDVMVNSFYPGAEHDEPPRLPSPDPNESVEERSHEEHVERDPIQAHDQTFEPGFISSSSHNVEEHRYEEETSEQQHNGIQDDENLEPPLSNRSLESFQRHEEEVAADIQHDNDVSSYNDNVADLEGGHDIYIENRENIQNDSIAPRGQLLNQPSIEITAPSDFGDAQVDEISAPPTPNSPAGAHAQTFNHEVIDHPVHQREIDVSDEEANENSGLLSNGHEGDHEDQGDEDDDDDDDDTGSVVMHKTPDSANYQQLHHQQQYQRSDDEQSETGQGHL